MIKRRRAAQLAIAISVVASACSSSGTATTAVPVSTPQTTSSGAAATAPPPTTTTVTSTTEATEPEEPEAQELSAVEWESDDGWKYEIVLSYVGDSVEAAPLECVGVPPPGKTNLVFEVAVSNLITDRPSPVPEMSFTVNLIRDGTIDEDRSAYDFEMGEHYPGDTIEVFPSNSSTGCGYTNYGPTDAEPISAGGILTFRVMAGPIPTSAKGVVLSYRIFPGGLRWTSVDTPLDDPDAVVILDGEGLG